jgi:drug/metabolite transporter (DMT)-like permease
VLSLLLAVLAAGCNAMASVLERKANKEERDYSGAQWVARLVSRPAWLLGIAAMIVSFLLQASALSLGTLSSVEPLLVLELPLALILGSFVLSQPLRTKDWVAALMMASGLGLLIGTLAPHGGDAAHAPLSRSLIATLATTGLVGLISLVAAGADGATRSALFGVAAGVGFGLTAGLIKLAVAHLSSDGVTGLFSAWPTYALVAAGLGSLALVQAALRAGTLVAAQPGMTLLDPLVSLLWGVAVVDERTRTGPIVVLAGVGAAAIAASAFVLARAAERAQARVG